MASGEFPFFLQASAELAEKLERAGNPGQAQLMRDYKVTFETWARLGRPADASKVIADFLTAAREAMTYVTTKPS